MLFGKPAGIPGFPRFILCNVKRMGWCLTDSGAFDPAFIGQECWFSTRRQLVAALDPIKADHIPMRSEVVRMVPRSALCKT